MILRSTDGGATWTQVRPQSPGDFSAPLALADGTLILTGYTGPILRSTDHGATWQEVQAPSSCPHGPVRVGPERFTSLTLADGTLILTGHHGTSLALC